MGVYWVSIEKTHQKDKGGKWVKMKEEKSFKEELAVSLSDYEYHAPGEGEIIDAINSVPSIPNKEKLVSEIDSRVRLIKGMPVLTEGVFNGVNYSEKVLREGADSWNNNPDKPGVKFKVKLEHANKVINRAGHLLKSYYDDGFVKQDILLTNKEAVDLWDGGLLDDVSVRMRVGTDMKNSNVRQLNASYIKGRGTDFVDNPACKSCGTNAEKESILQELSEEEDYSMADENRQEDNETEEKFSEKVKTVLQTLGILSDGEEEEEELCGDKKKKASKAEEEEEEEMDEKLEENSKEGVSISVTLEDLPEVKELIENLQGEVDSLKAEKEEILHMQKVDEVVDLHKKLGDEYDLEELKAKDDAVLEERLGQLKIRAKSTPSGDVPHVSCLSEEQASKLEEKNKELREELSSKGFQ